MKIKPKRLIEGSNIAVISPSYPAVYLYKKRLQRAVSFLKDRFKINIFFAPHASSKSNYVSSSAIDRASDIHWAFQNDEIDCIMAAIGGLNSNSILPYLNFDLIGNNPKIFVGYSDVTALLLPIYSVSNLITFHGPALMPEWGEYPYPFDYTVNSFYKTVFNNKAIGILDVPEFWTDEFLDWGTGADNRNRLVKKNFEWKSLVNGTAQGILFGGNIDTINFLFGTKYLLPPQEDIIFFFEITSLSSSAIDRALEQLLQTNILENIKGMIVGKFHAYDHSAGGQVQETQESHFLEIDKIILDKFEHLNIPIISRVDCGHTDPMLTLPIGVKAKIANNQIDILESAVL